MALKETEIVARAVGFSPHALVWVARPEPLRAGEDEEERSVSTSFLGREVLPCPPGLSSSSGARPPHGDRRLLTSRARAGIPSVGAWRAEVIAALASAC